MVERVLLGPGGATETTLDAVLSALTGSPPVTQGDPGLDPWPVSEATKLDLIPYAQRLTSSDSIMPASGKAIELVWCLIIPSAFNDAENLVTISMTFGGVSKNIYATPAVGRSAVFIGDVDEPLVITLENSWPVAVNLQYREI